MNSKAKALSALCAGTAELALLVTVSTPHAEKEYAPAPAVRLVSAFIQADRVISPPEPKSALVNKETSNTEPNSTPPTEIAFEAQKPNAVNEILTAKEPPRGKPTPKPSPSQNTATATTTAPQMGDTRMMDGQNQIYILGFGWIEDSDEPNVSIVVDGDGDINKMVGIM